MATKNMAKFYSDCNSVTEELPCNFVGTCSGMDGESGAVLKGRIDEDRLQDATSMAGREG